MKLSGSTIETFNLLASHLRNFKVTVPLIEKFFGDQMCPVHRAGIYLELFDFKGLKTFKYFELL